MASSQALLQNILQTFRAKGYAQVPGYNKFGYIRETGNAVIVSREAGQDTRIPFDKIVEAIEAVRKDSKVYTEGPSALRAHGITHITSPLWALVNLLPQSEYRAGLYPVAETVSVVVKVDSWLMNWASTSSGVL